VIGPQVFPNRQNGRTKIAGPAGFHPARAPIAQEPGPGLVTRDASSFSSIWGGPKGDQVTGNL
jgi:hypothetical protein